MEHSKEFVYKTILNWLESCITQEQIDLCVEVANNFLKERLSAEEEYNSIVLLAHDKSHTPNTKIKSGIKDY